MLTENQIKEQEAFERKQIKGGIDKLTVQHYKSWKKMLMHQPQFMAHHV